MKLRSASDRKLARSWIVLLEEVWFTRYNDSISLELGTAMSSQQINKQASKQANKQTNKQANKQTN
jgi:hypothetical protein